MLSTILGKKKMTEEAIADVMVNSILNCVSKGFPDVAGIINDDQNFETQPEINDDDGYQFLLIVLTGNICFIPKYFDSGKDKRIIEYLIGKTSELLECEKRQLAQDISDCKKEISRVNYPSKNTVYGMSKVLFFRYRLNQFQEDYFKTLNAPKPQFLKKMDEINKLFIFNWSRLFEKFKVA